MRVGDALLVLRVHRPPHVAGAVVAVRAAEATREFADVLDGDPEADLAGLAQDVDAVAVRGRGVPDLVSGYHGSFLPGPQLGHRREEAFHRAVPLDHLDLGAAGVLGLAAGVVVGAVVGPLVEPTPGVLVVEAVGNGVGADHDVDLRRRRDGRLRAGRRVRDAGRNPAEVDEANDPPLGLAEVGLHQAPVMGQVGELTRQRQLP